METNIRTKQLNFCQYRGYLSVVRLQFPYFQKKVGLYRDFLIFCSKKWKCTGIILFFHSKNKIARKLCYFFDEKYDCTETLRVLSISKCTFQTLCTIIERF